MILAKRFGNWLASNWERLLFASVGFAFLTMCFYSLYADKLADAAALFGLGFFSFIYANVARFKRFKGLGFEAELWEDKQKEAADLIERLREVVSIYTRELIIGRVMSGRLRNGPDWRGHWKLYDDLVTQHSILGQKIDFSDLKKTMDDLFLFDMEQVASRKLRQSLFAANSLAMQKINQEFGTPIRDSDGYGKRIEHYRLIPAFPEEPFEISAKGDLAGYELKVWEDAKSHLKQNFGVELEIDPRVLDRLSRISKLYDARPVKVTDELIEWAADRGLDK